VFVGKHKIDQPRTDILAYDKQSVIEVGTVEEALAKTERPRVTWVRVIGLDQPDTFERLGETLSLHPLLLEDVLNTTERPKVDVTDNWVLISLKAYHEKPAGAPFESDQVSIILGSDCVLSFEEHDEPAISRVAERIRSNIGRVRAMGEDYLAYALVDSLVDEYFVLLDALSERMEVIEDRLVQDPVPQTLNIIYATKSDVSALRRNAWPLREAVGKLSRGDSPFFHPATRVYLRDVYDHLVQVMDTLDTHRDMLSTMVDIYLSTVSNRLNAVMQVLTVIATIFIPLTFITGIYGMNFQHMPELAWKWGYPAALGIMALVAATMLAYFHRKGWL
jgi:magnesium transporter